MYEYLLATLIAFVFWFIIYGTFPKLRKPMLWGAITYTVIPTAVFLIWKFFSIFVSFGKDVIPGYWNPPVIFDLGIRFGLTIEDVLFMFAMGGIVSVCYEMLTKHRAKEPPKPHHHWGVIGIFVLAIFACVFAGVSAMYSLLGGSLLAAIYLFSRRPDLFIHSLLSGVIFTAFYTVYFLLVLAIWPDFAQYWNLEAISGILIIGIPFEEYLYAFTLGLMWGPLYEYVRHAKLR